MDGCWITNRFVRQGSSCCEKHAKLGVPQNFKVVQSFIDLSADFLAAYAYHHTMMLPKRKRGLYILCELVKFENEFLAFVQVSYTEMQDRDKKSLLITIGYPHSDTPKMGLYLDHDNVEEISMEIVRKFAKSNYIVVTYQFDKPNKPTFISIDQPDEKEKIKAAISILRSNE